MKIAKEFRWEMGHRLPNHKGKCRNLHGHSYKVLVEFEGNKNEDGMLIDYYDVKAIVMPIVDNLDHSFMVTKDDTELIDALRSLNSKMEIVNYYATAENICDYFLEKIKSAGLPKNISALSVWVYETESTYATKKLKLI